VKALKAARAEASRNFALFGQRNVKGGDDAGRVIERMVDADVTEQEVANFLWGSSRVGESGRAYRVIKRVGEIVGRDSEEWDAVRRGMWQKVISSAEGTEQPGAQATARNIAEFVNGKGKGIAEELYSAAELSKMRRFAAVLRSTVPPKDATNPSKSGYEVARAMGDIFNVNAPFYIRIFGLAGNARSTVRAATGGGAPALRTPAPAGTPAIGAVATDRHLTEE